LKRKALLLQQYDLNAHIHENIKKKKKKKRKRKRKKEREKKKKKKVEPPTNTGNAVVCAAAHSGQAFVLM